jgi:hypothetical protein
MAKAHARKLSLEAVEGTIRFIRVGVVGSGLGWIVTHRRIHGVWEWI